MSFVPSLLKVLIARMPEGPSDEVLRTGRRVLVGVVTNARGESARARVTTGQGNVLTAQAGVEIAQHVIAGEAKPGFQTPSLVYGPDFILQFEGIPHQAVVGANETAGVHSIAGRRKPPSLRSKVRLMHFTLRPMLS